MLSLPPINNLSDSFVILSGHTAQHPLRHTFSEESTLPGRDSSLAAARQAGCAVNPLRMTEFSLTPTRSIRAPLHNNKGVLDGSTPSCCTILVRARAAPIQPGR
jgi:hypothetical protein